MPISSWPSPSSGTGVSTSAGSVPSALPILRPSLCHLVSWAPISPLRVSRRPGRAPGAPSATRFGGLTVSRAPPRAPAHNRPSSRDGEGCARRTRRRRRDAGLGIRSVRPRHRLGGPRVRSVGAGAARVSSRFATRRRRRVRSGAPLRPRPRRAHTSTALIRRIPDAIACSRAISNRRPRSSATDATCGPPQNSRLTTSPVARSAIEYTDTTSP